MFIYNENKESGSTFAFLTFLIVNFNLERRTIRQEIEIEYGIGIRRRIWYVCPARQPVKEFAWQPRDLVIDTVSSRISRIR